MFVLADSSAILLNACCKMMLLNKTRGLSKADIPSHLPCHSLHNGFSDSSETLGLRMVLQKGILTATKVTVMSLVWWFFSPFSSYSPFSYHHRNQLWHHRCCSIHDYSCKNKPHCAEVYATIHPSIIVKSHIAGENYDKKGKDKIDFPEVMFNLKPCFGVKTYISLFAKTSLTLPSSS